LWEIAESTKPHSDLRKEDMLVSIRKRISEKYSLPFSDDVPIEWRSIVVSGNFLIFYSIKLKKIYFF
jgi:hypothetical protein